MEESDNLLITTLRQFIKVSPNINNLKDIRTQQIFAISINVLEQLNFDTAEVKLLSAKQQKFRAMAKLNQSLQAALQTQFQLNDLMNPSVPFLRKFMLMLINKLGSGQSNQKSKMKKQVIENKKQGIKQLKKWLGEEWIHPSLCVKKQKYRGYFLPLTINKNMLKNNINLTAELNNPLLSCNNQAILNATSDKLNQRVKQFEANQGFSRKQNQQAQIRLQNIIKFNKDDWNITGNKLQKLKKKVIETQNQNQSQIQVPVVGSVFKLELEQAESQQKKKKEEFKPKFQRNQVQQTAVSMNPLQLLKKQAQNRKRQYENEIQDILNQLNQRKQAIQQWERRKQQIETQNIADQQRITKLKQQTIELKKKVEKRQTILATLEGEKDIEEETNKLQGELDMIENQVKEEVNRIQKQIKEMETQSKEKMEALGDLKAKLARVQDQYQKICEEITQKQELKGNVKIQTSTISRLYYHKKISEMEARWRQTDKEIKKLKATLKELRQKTRIASTLSTRVQTQIQNILNVQKTRNQPQTKLLRQLMLKCKEAYQKTMNILQEASIIKMQTQEYEVKVHTLSGKNYKQNIQKINYAMEDLKKETAQFLKSKNR